MLFNILSFSILGGVLSLIGGIALLFRKDWSHGSILVMISFASGVLLATSFVDLLPEALELSVAQQGDPTRIFEWALLAIAGFFLFERSFAWFHHHHHLHKTHPNPVIPMVWIGDTLHNAIDGIAITASFFVSIPLGVTTAIAVAAHELPQEIADFSLYLAKGVGRSKTLLLNVLSSLSTILMASLSYFFWDYIGPIQPQLLAFTAGMFIYIAGSDLIPELHGTYHRRHVWLQSAAFIAGLLLTRSLGGVR